MDREDQISLDSVKSRFVQASSAHLSCNVHVATFQPTNSPSEDRYFVEDWELSNGSWKFAAIFDGHAGSETVDFVLASLPSMIKDGVSSCVDGLHGKTTLDDVLTQCLIAMDERIQNAFISMFPGGPNQLANLSDDDIRAIITDPTSSDGSSFVEVRRVRTGTTATVALISPNRSIYVACLGDSDAVYATNEDGTWKTNNLGAHHNCENEMEVARIKAEHPEEPGCVNTETFRTLGLITLTRALGDTIYKIPSIYAKKVISLSKPPLHPNYDLDALVARNIIPPYLSNIPEVAHVVPSATKGMLILASDGLINIFSRTTKVRLVSEAAPMWCTSAVSGSNENMALNVLWDALGGDGDENILRAMINGEHMGRVDDITILVVWI